MSTVTRSVIVRLRAEMAQFKKEWNDGTGAVKGTREELNRASKQAKATGKDLDGTGTTVGKLSKNLRENRSEWDLVGSSLLKTGAVLAVTSGLMTKAAIDWETAWAGVTKTVSGTPAELDAVEAGLRRLAKTMPESHTQIAAVAEAAGQLGVKTKDIVAFTNVMVMLGDTTNLTADEAATSIAQLMNVMQTAPEDVDRLGATLVALGNDGASTERDIIQMAQRIAGAGEIIGLTEAQVLSLANALASSGIEVEAGGSSISNVLIDISKAVSAGGTQLDMFAKVAGTTATDFASKWKSAPASALTDFIEGLGGMADRGEDVFGTLAKLGQTDIRVTRSLLNMANAGDLLRDSLSTGDAAWQKNTALVEEAEKRYDTTAAKIEIAWNNIKDNAIDAGQGMLPVLSAVSDVVVALAEAFGSLSDPVKAGLGILAGGTGVALLAAGAFLKVVGTARDLRTAFTRLDASGSAGARGIGKVGKAAGIAGAALAALQIAGALVGDSGEREGVNKYTQAILDLASGTKGAKKSVDDLSKVDAPGWSGFLYKDIKGLDEALDELAAGKGFQDRTSGLLNLETRLDAAKKSVDKFDAGFASLVTSGDQEDAAKGFEYFVDTADAQGISLEQLMKLFPQYQDALDGVKIEQDQAAKSGEDLAAAAGGLQQRLAELSPDAEEAQKILAELEQSTSDAALGFLDLAAKIDTSKTSFNSWLKDLENQHKAMENWADNLIKATQRGVSEGVIKEFEKMGPEGAKRLAELVDASDKEIDRLNDVFADTQLDASRLAEILNALPSDVITEFKTPGAKDAIETAQELALKYNLAPDQVETILRALDYASDDIDKVLEGLGVVDGKTVTAKVKADTVAAQKAIKAFQDWFNSINLFRSATVRYGDDNRAPKADGGPITGVGGPKQDNIPIAASVGEHMWTAREVANVGGHGAMYSMRAQARAGKRPKFAVGGAVDDAWSESFRSAAAAYASPVMSVPAAPSGGSSSSQVLSVDVTGVSVGYDKNNRPVLIGELRAAIATQNRYEKKR